MAGFERLIGAGSMISPDVVGEVGEVGGLGVFPND